MQHTTARAHDPAFAVPQQANGIQRISGEHRQVLRSKGPRLAAVRGLHYLPFQTHGHPACGVHEADAKEGWQVQRIIDPGVAQQSVLLLLPVHATVGRVVDLAELTDHPAGLVVDEVHVVQDGIAHRQGRFFSHPFKRGFDVSHLPRLPAAGGAQIRGLLRHCPAVVLVRERKGENGLVDPALLPMPGLPTVSGVQDQSILSAYPTSLGIDELDVIQR